MEAYILLKVEPGFERRIFQQLENLKEVTDLNELYGEWDIIAKVDVKEYLILILFFRKR